MIEPRADSEGEAPVRFGRHPEGGLRHLGGALGLFCLGALFLLSWPSAPRTVHLGAFGALGLSLCWAASWVLHWRRRSLLLTAQELVLGAGIAGRRRAIPLGELRGATVEQRIRDRLIGTGSVSLILRDGSTLELHDVRRPNRLVAELATACRRAGVATGDAPGRPGASPVAPRLLHARGIITARELAELDAGASRHTPA